MTTVRRPLIPVLVLVLLITAAAQAEPVYTATPAVSATAMPYGTDLITEEFQMPVTPLLAEATAGSGGNTAWAQAVPGRLRATSTVANTPESWQNSQGVALFVDNFQLQNPAMPDNASGVFFFRFYLSGVMRILASDPMSSAHVYVGGGTILGGTQAGQLNFGRVDGVPTLYAVSGGSGNPGDNILAGPDGDMQVYGTTTSQSDGYYEIHVGVPVTFVYQDMPINRSPQVDDWQNQVEVRLSAVSFSNAACDFSSTFEFAAQNPIVPDPEATLQSTGWTYDSASGEIALPAPLAVATSTGSGEAVFRTDQGDISGLTALTLGDFPAGLTGGDFAHGWFGLDLTLIEGETQAGVAITLPQTVGTGAHWWWHDGAGWQSIPLDDDDGDDDLVLTVLDNGLGDTDPAAGVITLAGGLSNSAPVPNLVSAFRAVWSGGGVDLVWHAPAVDPARLVLAAHLDGRAWSVALHGDGRGGYAARDASPALSAGGTVRYDLELDGRILESRAVELPVFSAAKLDRIAPNPFNPRVEIAYTVAVGSGPVELAIHDLQGRRVAVLVNGDPGGGSHLVVWDGTASDGRAVPSGIYLVRLATVQKVEARKISLVR